MTSTNANWNTEKNTENKLGDEVDGDWEDSLVRCSDIFFEQVKSKLKMNMGMSLRMQKLNNLEEIDNHRHIPHARSKSRRNIKAEQTNIK